MPHRCPSMDAWLQPAPRAVAACTTRGFSLHHARLQAQLEALRAMLSGSVASLPAEVQVRLRSLLHLLLGGLGDTLLTTYNNNVWYLSCTCLPTTPLTTSPATPLITPLTTPLTTPLATPLSTPLTTPHASLSITPGGVPDVGQPRYLPPMPRYLSPQAAFLMAASPAIYLPCPAIYHPRRRS